MKKRCLFIPCVTLAVAWLGSFFTHFGMAWYHTLVLSAATPPDWVFGVVWTIIFILATVSALLFCMHSSDRSKAFYITMILFCCNALVNVAWSFLFFYMYMPCAALVDAFFLTVTVVLLIGRLWQKERLAAWCLVPYALWSFFALYLNAAVVYFN